MKKKKIGIIGGIVVTLFIAPLIVFATVYKSNKPINSFEPEDINIAVHEGDNAEGEELKKDDYEWKKINDNSYSVEKLVQIKDTRKNPDEALRVSFIPMWYDKSEDTNNQEVISDVYSGVFNFNNITFADNKLIYCDHNPEDDDDHSKDKLITLNMVSDWNENWIYSDPNNQDNPGDGCFYYTGDLNNNHLTETLLSSVELNGTAYELTKDYVFQLDVLADAIQAYDNAKDNREWDNNN